jgi:hypothetical protein
LIFEEGIRRKPRRVECTQAVFDFFPFGFPFGLL